MPAASGRTDKTVSARASPLQAPPLPVIPPVRYYVPVNRNGTFALKPKVLDDDRASPVFALAPRNGVGTPYISR